MNNNAYSIKELANKSALYHERINMTRTIEAKVMLELDHLEQQDHYPTTEKETLSPQLEFSELTFNDQEARETYVLIFLVSIFEFFLWSSNFLSCILSLPADFFPKLTQFIVIFPRLLSPASVSSFVTLASLAPKPSMWNKLLTPLDLK